METGQHNANTNGRKDTQLERVGLNRQKSPTNHAFLKCTSLQSGQRLPSARVPLKTQDGPKSTRIRRIPPPNQENNRRPPQPQPQPQPSPLSKMCVDMKPCVNSWRESIMAPTRALPVTVKHKSVWRCILVKKWGSSHCWTSQRSLSRRADMDRKI